MTITKEEQMKEVLDKLEMLHLKMKKCDLEAVSYIAYDGRTSSLSISSIKTLINDIIKFNRLPTTIISMMKICNQVWKHLTNCEKKVK